MSDDFECRMKCSRRVERKGEMCRTCEASFGIYTPQPHTDLETSLPTVVVLLIVLAALFAVAANWLLE